MVTASPLTPAQAQVYRLIQVGFKAQGRAPAYREIARQLGNKSVGTIQDHIAQLVRHGYLKKLAGRGITLPNHEPSFCVPILGRVPAGNPLEAFTDFQGSIALIGAPGAERDLYALRVTGESMIERGIFNGDVIVVRSQSTAEHRDVVVALLNDEATVKVLEKRRGQMRLMPANPAFSPISFQPETQNHRIVGRVLSVHRFF